MAATLSMYERETIITFNQEEKHAIVYSANPVTIRKLDSMVARFPKQYSVIREDDLGKEYRIESKYLIRFASPAREYSEEEKKRLAEKFKENLNKKKENAEDDE